MQDAHSAILLTGIKRFIGLENQCLVFEGPFYIKKMNTKEIHGDMVETLCEDTVSYSTAKKWVTSFSPLLHRLILDHDIIFLFFDNIEKIQEKLKLRFEYF